MRTHNRWSWEYAIFLAGLVLTGGLLITLLTACAPRYIPVIPVPTDENILAWTTCDQQGNIAVLYYENPDTTLLKYILLHEQTHVMQIKNFGDCFAFMRKYQAEKAFQLEIEAEAECTALALALAEGYYIDLSEIFAFYRQRFTTFTEEEVLRAFYCMRRNGQTP